MALGILITAVLLFALRGMLLGFSGVIGRLLGLVFGYFVAHSYRIQLAEFITLNTSINLPAIVLQMISGLGLFIFTIFITGLVVSVLFKLLGSAIPLFGAIADNNSVAGKVAGATLNGAIAATIVLLAIWGVGQVTPQQNAHDPVQQIAKQFGDKIFAMIADSDNFNIQHFSQSFSQTTVTNNSSSHYSGFSSTAIGDTSNKLSIDSVIEILQQSGQSLENLDPAELINNIELPDMTLEQLENNPELLQNIQQQIINNPQLMELMQRLQPQQP